ncbi:Capsule polysaccharide biosynthesis protein [Mycobacteroides abscessus subsp. abscessus]|nr:Capsule polysaccharide biosynthesis protein [Mycobacteroides abscessus subsp. abscessus]
MKIIIKKMLKKIRNLIEIIRFLFVKIPENDKQVALMFEISKWKQPYMNVFLPEFNLVFVPKNINLVFLDSKIKKYSKVTFIVWGFNESTDIQTFALQKNIPLYRVEDGFLRSIGLGAMHNPPYSLCLDKKGMYFDSSKPSDLEDILNFYDFSKNAYLIHQAKVLIKELTSKGISKYNHINSIDIEKIYGKKKKNRILVIGQVEDDASIKKGADKPWTNNDLVKLAYNENPNSQIIYKPHPDVLSRKRKMQSNPEDIKHLALIVNEPLSLSDSFKTIDHVYTITSLSGFEALLRGIKVTTVGAPFYSGWSLTDDRQVVKRRNRKLTIEELFAGAYILYPRYANPINGEKINIEKTIELLSRSKEI